MDILRTHPMAIIGGVLRENPFFVPPDQLLRELRQRSGDGANGSGGAHGDPGGRSGGSSDG